MSGTFIMCCTGATSRSVSCSFLHRGSLLHHCKPRHRLRRQHYEITGIYIQGVRARGIQYRV
jgi:hypothetical protein